MVHALFSDKENVCFIRQKKKKLNKLNWLPQFYREQRPIANP